MTCACGQTRCSCRNPNISFMAHLWEDLRVLHKPLAVHLLSELGALGTHAWLRMHGFQRFRHGVCACPAEDTCIGCPARFCLKCACLSLCKSCRGGLGLWLWVWSVKS